MFQDGFQDGSHGRQIKKSPAELIMENAQDPGKEWNVAHPTNMSQPRLRAIKVTPLAEQTNSWRPAFEVPAAFQPPVVAGAVLGEGKAKVAHPDEVR